MSSMRPRVPENGTERVPRPAGTTGLAITITVLCVVAAVVTVVQGGAAAAPVVVIPVTGIVLVWWLLWYPRVELDDERVLIVNPVRSWSVPWDGLITVETKLGLTLLTPERKVVAWAAPAPGPIRASSTHVGELDDLPSTTYGVGRGVRPGDLGRTASGVAAIYVRRRWEKLVDAGRLNAGEVEDHPVTSRWNVVPLTAVAVFVLAALYVVSNYID